MPKKPETWRSRRYLLPTLSELSLETAKAILTSGRLTYLRLERTNKAGRRQRIYAWCDSTGEPVNRQSMMALIRHGIAKFKIENKAGATRAYQYRSVVIDPAGYTKLQAAIVQTAKRKLREIHEGARATMGAPLLCDQSPAAAARAAASAPSTHRNAGSSHAPLTQPDKSRLQ